MDIFAPVSWRTIFRIILFDRNSSLLSPVLSESKKFFLFIFLRSKLTIIQPSLKEFNLISFFGVKVSPGNIKINLPASPSNQMSTYFHNHDDLIKVITAMLSKKLVISIKEIKGFCGLAGFSYLLCSSSFEKEKLIQEIKENPNKFNTIILNGYSEALRYQK